MTWLRGLKRSSLIGNSGQTTVLHDAGGPDLRKWPCVHNWTRPDLIRKPWSVPYFYFPETVVCPLFSIFARSFCYVDDLVEGLVRLIYQPDEAQARPDASRCTGGRSNPTHRLLPRVNSCPPTISNRLLLPPPLPRRGGAKRRGGRRGGRRIRATPFPG